MAEFSDADRQMIWSAVHTAPAVDVRVLGEAADLLHPGVSGIDALLTTPDLLAEFFRRRGANRPSGDNDPSAPGAADASLLSLERSELADIVWRQLFIDHSPISEPARMALTTLGMFGLDVRSGDLRQLRDNYEAIPTDERLNRSLQLANVEMVLYPVESMTAEKRDPFAETGGTAFKPVLYLNELLGNWRESARLLRLRGFGLKAKVDEFTPLELRRYLSAEIDTLHPLALGLDWPGSEHVPADGGVGKLMRESVLPLCRERGLPFLLNSGSGRVDDLAEFWRSFPEVRFLLFPGRRDEFAPAIQAASRSRNLLLGGADRPLSHPRILGDCLGACLETLGDGFHALHSGADVAEELVGCWAHSRWVLGETLIRHYSDLWRTGWKYSEEDVQKTIRAILGGNALSLLHGPAR